MTEDMTGFLLDQFEILADAPGGVQRLRELILQLAVTGRLGTGDETDEPANISLKNIKSEIESLKQTGYVRKKSSNSSESFIESLKLPLNWVWTSLTEVTHHWGQKVPNTDFVYIDVSSIDNQKGKIKADLTILSAKEAPSRARKLVRIGTVIFSTVRPYLKNCAIIEEDFNHETIVSTAFAILHPYSCLSSKFLLYYLRSSIFIRYTEGEMLGMAYPAINDAKLLIGPIPLPPLPEQQRIVEKVDNLMALCDDLEAKQTQKHSHLVKLGTGSLNALQQSTTEEELIRWWGHLQTNFGLIFDCVENVEALRQTILQLAVTGRLGTNKIAENVVKSISTLEISSQSLNDYLVTLSNVPQNWIWCKLSDLADVKSGVTKNSSQKIDDPIEVPYLRVANVQRGFLDLTHMKTIIVSKLRLPELTLKKGDILFTEGGDFDKLGRGWIWNEEIQCCTHQNHIFRARLNTDQILGEYISYYANYEGVNYFQQCSKQTTNLASINSKQLKNFPIPIPPLAEQHRIIEKVECLMNFCDDLERGIEKRDNKEIVLSNAILQKNVIMT